MIIPIAGIVPADILAQADAWFADAVLEDGKSTAGWHAKLVKNNEQSRAGDGVARALKKQLMQCLQTSAVFQQAALPRHLSTLLLSRYRPGMDYGNHVDNALMQAHGLMRSDVSFTLFLTSPERYQGGELVIETHAGALSYKLPAGAAIVYPSNSLHRVEPVTSGERLVAVGWAQSLVRQPAQREILFDLERARLALFEASGKSEQFDLLSKSHANLLRMWAEI